MSTATAVPSQAPGHDRTTQTPDRDPLKAAKTPVGPGAVTYLGAFLALVVILAGVMGLQTGAAAAGLTTSRPWLTRAIDGTNGLRPLAWAVPIGVLLVLVGLWLLAAGVWPRPKTAVAVDAQTGVFLRPRDLAQLAQDAADNVDGVAAVHAKASLRRVTLDVQSTGGDGVGEDVRRAVDQRLAPLEKTVQVNVNTKKVAL